MSKIDEIIKKEFDSRMAIMVFQYILVEGTEKVKNFTDDEIKTIKGNALMTDDFVQSMVKCARRVCREVEPIDILREITHLSMQGAMKYEVELYKDDFIILDDFERIADKFDCDDNTTYIKLWAELDEE